MTGDFGQYWGCFVDFHPFAVVCCQRNWKKSCQVTIFVPKPLFFWKTIVTQNYYYYYKCYV